MSKRIAGVRSKRTYSRRKWQRQRQKKSIPTSPTDVMMMMMMTWVGAYLVSSFIARTNVCKHARTYHHITSNVSQSNQINSIRSILNRTFEINAFYANFRCHFTLIFLFQYKNAQWLINKHIGFGIVDINILHTHTNTIRFRYKPGKVRLLFRYWCNSLHGYA